MARTQQQIYTDLIAEKATSGFASLSGLNSTSQTAIWRLWLNLVAFAIWVHESLWDIAQADIQAIVDAAIPGTPEWYVKMIKLYQKGDSIQLDTNTLIPFYADVNPSNQIITRASVVERNGALVIKVAKNDPPVKLSDGSINPADNELSELQGYIQAIKFAGTRFALISQDADQLSCAQSFMSGTVQSIVWYDPQYDPETLSEAIDVNMGNYLANLPFNGLFRKSDFEAAVKGTPGVIDFELYILRASSDGGTTWTYLVQADGDGQNPATLAPTYLPLSGHISLNDIAFDMFKFLPYVR